MSSFDEKLTRRIRAIDSILCIGLDPHRSELKIEQNASLEELARAAEHFCVDLIDKTVEHACSFKPNAAFFEALGSKGVEALERVLHHIPSDVPIIFDCKRGDISTTAQGYAEAAFKVNQCDAVTLHPYMGWDSIEPFLQDESKGVFVLTKTSNPSSSEFQELQCSTGKLYEHVAQSCVSWKEKSTRSKSIGLVVGATDPAALQKVRSIAPELWILAPGVGFQGGDLDQCVQSGLRRSDGLGLIVPVSRGVSRSENPNLAASEFKMKLRSAVAEFIQQQGKAKRLRDATLAEHQTNFLTLAIECGVLKFGNFTLKSGRESPYFFNAGLFNTGRSMEMLARCYSETIMASKVEFDVIFGPAYKGIPLSSCVSASMFINFNKDVPFCYNRKEVKDHGEGGLIVGAHVGKGTRVLILDDVITAGTAVREAVHLVSSMGAKVVGLVVSLDRQEVFSDTCRLSAVESVEKEFGFKVYSIVGLQQILLFSQSDPDVIGGTEMVDKILAYRSKYGI